MVSKRAMLQFEGNALRRDKEVIIQHCQEFEEISQLRERCRDEGITGAAVFTLTKTATTLACSRLLEELVQTFLNVVAFSNHTEDNHYHPGGFSKTNPLTSCCLVVWIDPLLAVQSYPGYSFNPNVPDSFKQRIMGNHGWIRNPKYWMRKEQLNQLGLSSRHLDDATKLINFGNGRS